MTRKDFEKKLRKTRKIIENFERKKRNFLKILKSYESKLQNKHNINFAVKIVTNGKVDTKYYNNKLKKILLSLKKLPPTKSVDEKLIKKVNKIENNFVRLTTFIREYSKVISKKNLTEKDITHLKFLERQEINYALRNLSSIYLSLKNASFEDILEKENLKNVKRVVPVLGDLFKKLFTNDSQLYNLKTPFGIVNVQLKSQPPYGIEFIIYHDRKAWSYNEICQNLDLLFIDNKSSNVIHCIIHPIMKYLKNGKAIDINKIKSYYEKQYNDDIEKNAVIQEIFNLFTTSNANIRSLNFEKVPMDNVVASAASLSGILILAEACQYRSPTFGKLERNAMKTVLRLSQNNCKNPFCKVFNNKKGRYVPAHSQGGNIDTQLLLSYNFDNDSIKARFLPIPIGETKVKKIRELFINIIIGEGNLEEIYSKLYPFKYTGFLKEMIAKKYDKNTITQVFEKLNFLFPETFPTAGEFIEGNNKFRKETIESILNFGTEKSKIKNELTDTEIESAKKFVNFLKNEAYTTNQGEKLKTKLNNFSFEKLTQFINNMKSNGFGEHLVVKVNNFYKGLTPDKYVEIKTIPEIPGKYLGLNTDLKTFIRNKLDKLLKKLYKSQNQTFTKKQIKNLLS